MIRAVIADDHPIVLAGFGALLKRETDIDVVAHCADGVEAMRAVGRHRPDILVLDLRMPRADGIAVLEHIRNARVPTRVVVLAAVVDDEALAEVVRLGAHGVVLKEMAPRVLVKSLREVHADRRCFAPDMLRTAMQNLLRRRAAGEELHASLSRRELDVVHAVAQGLRNREIAAKLAIAEATVKLHLHSVYTKLDVHSRLALIVKLKNTALIGGERSACREPTAT